MYAIDKTVLLFVWYYFFYKALFLKVVVLEHSFESGWDLPYQEEEDGDDDDEHRVLSKRYAEEVNAWFEREKPYLREDLRLTDLQRIFPISRSYLSQLFNRELGQSFSDYVNQFRIEESKRLMDTIRSVRSGELSRSVRVRFRRSIRIANKHITIFILPWTLFKLLLPDHILSGWMFFVLSPS